MAQYSVNHLQEAYANARNIGNSSAMQYLQKLLADRKITIKLDPSAREWLAEKGWDPAYGARPLKRVIQRELQNTLAGLILAGRVKDGETVTISAGKQGLTFNGKLAQAA